MFHVKKERGGTAENLKISLRPDDEPLVLWGRATASKPSCCITGLSVAFGPHGLKHVEKRKLGGAMSSVLVKEDMNC